MRKVVYIVIGLLTVMAFGFVFYPTKKNQAAPIAQSNKKIENPTAIEEQHLTADADPNPYVRQLLEEYQRYISKAISTGQAPGAAVAIVRDTSIIFLRGFGLRKAGTQDSIDVNSVFRLGSVSKCFAAILTGTLVKDQLMNWDDKVTRYVPDFQLKQKSNTDSLRIRNVLSHTIGLPYHAYTSMVEDGVPLDTLLIHLKDLDLVSKPGKMYSYQNVGYSLIEKIISSVTGKSYEESMTEKLFQPLHMQHASVSYASIMGNVNVAEPHFFTKRGWHTTTISNTYYNVAPAGGINASISDMGLLLKALVGTRQDILPDKTLDEILTPQVKAISKNRNFWQFKRTRGSYYAMGWRVLTFKNDTLDYHGGYVNGYRSELALDRKNKMAICVLVNAAGHVADQSIPHFFALRNKYIDRINEWERENQTLLAKR